MRTFTLLLAAFALTACGGDAREQEPAAPPSAATGPGLSIEEALASDVDGPLLVNGNLLAEQEEVRFCSALAESFPPQCGGPSLLVEGLDLGTIDGLTKGSGVTWSDRPIQLLGTVENGVLTVSETSL